MSITLALCIIGAAVITQVVLAAYGRRHLRRLGVSLPLALGLCAALLVAGALVRLLFWQLDLDLDRNPSILWACTTAFAALVGFVGAVWARRMPTVELFIAVLLTFEIAAVYAFAYGTGEGVAAPPLRALLIAPAALLLCSYFGASLGFLLWSSGRLDFKLGYEALIGRRFLLSKSSSVLSTVTTISVFGVALGVWLVIISLGILGGFEDDLQRKIIGSGAHGVVQQRGGWPVEVDAADLEAIAHVDGVKASAPYVEGEVALASQSNYTIGLLFGIDPTAAPEVLSVLRQITRGSLEGLADEMQPIARPAIDPEAEFLPPAPVPSIVIGREMANTLNVGVGERVRVISPLLQEMTPIGMAPRSLDFRVAGIFSSQMYEFDARFVYASLKSARRFFDLGPRAVSGIHLVAEDAERSELVGAAVVAKLASRVTTEHGWEMLDWKTRNQTLFAALKLERVVAFVVLVFIILVASFSIVSTLTMSVIEKRKEIAIIKTMGGRDVGIMKLFLIQGMLVGTFGTLIGALAAVLTAVLLKRIGFGIPGEVYYIDSLPVHVSAGDVVLIVLAALLIVWDFAVFPAIRGSQLEPVEGLRDG